MDFYEHLSDFLDENTINKIKESINLQEIHCLRLNKLKENPLFDLLMQSRGVSRHPYINDAIIYDKSLNEFGKSILFDSGAYYIQEPSAMMSEHLLNILPSERVLDMCAAPGGKSFDALVDMMDNGLLVCNDIHNIRAKILSSNIEKYGFKNAIVLNSNSNIYKKHFTNYFDKIILDAPCSGSAMFRKNVQVLNQWSIEKVYECQKIQKELLKDAYEMLKPGGKLLYSTCSFSIQENEEVIMDFLKQYEDIEIEPIALNKQYSDTIKLSGGLRLYPHQFAGEGQTIFILKKKVGEYVQVRNKFIKPTIVCKPLKDFLKEIEFQCDLKNIISFKNHYYLVEFEKIDLSGIQVLRYGLDLGEEIKGRFIPSHALAMYHQINKKLFIELNEEEALLYLKGLDIYRTGSSGYKIASYKGLALGWVKHANNHLKNHYPKGLRRNF